MASSNATDFVIEEYNIKDARKIVLRGRSLPFQGVAWTSKQRVDINYFPGNPVAIAQVIGSTWEDTKAEGRWSDLFFIDDEHSPDLINFTQLVDTASPHLDEAVAQRRTNSGIVDNTTSSTYQSSGAPPGQRARTAEQARDAMWKLSRGGQLLRVEWGPLVRFGYIVEFTATHDRREDIRWEITFAWIGDKPTQPKPSSKQDSIYDFVGLPVEDYYALLKLLNGNREPVVDTGSLKFGNRPVVLQNTAFNSSLNIVPIFLEKYRRYMIQYIRKANSFVTELLATLERIIRTTEPIDPRTLFGNIKSSLAGVRIATDQVLLAFDTLGAAVSAAKDTGGNPSDVTVLDGLQREFRKLALKLAAQCRIQEDNIDRFVTPNIRTIVRPNYGTTLRDISMQEYGTANNWRAIQEFNGFPDSVIPAGAIVRVPEIPVGNVTRDRPARNSAPSSLTVTGII